MEFDLLIGSWGHGVPLGFCICSDFPIHFGTRILHGRLHSTAENREHRENSIQNDRWLESLRGLVGFCPRASARGPGGELSLMSGLKFLFCPLAAAFEAACFPANNSDHCQKVIFWPVFT